jgi:hypothetical protein
MLTGREEERDGDRDRYRGRDSVWRDARCFSDAGNSPYLPRQTPRFGNRGAWNCNPAPLTGRPLYLALQVAAAFAPSLLASTMPSLAPQPVTIAIIGAGNRGNACVSLLITFARSQNNIYCMTGLCQIRSRQSRQVQGRRCRRAASWATTPVRGQTQCS